MSLDSILVCDNGTGIVKAGFAGDSVPRSTFPSLMGRPMLRAEDEFTSNVALKDLYIGDECADVVRGLELSYPIENGIIRNWDDMEELWKYTFGKLGVRLDPKGNVPKNSRIILTEAPLNPKENRKKMCEIMIEKFGFSAMQCKPQAVLTLYARGATTGVVVDSGDGVSHIMAVYEGYLQEKLTRRLNVAGRHVTRQLITLLQQRGYALNSTVDFEVVREMKEKLCYIASNFEKEIKLADETCVLVESYTLPDGRQVKVNGERFEATEILFSPLLMGLECGGLSDLTYDCIQSAPVDLRPELFKNIIVSGGTSMIPGFSSRLEKDLRGRYLTNVLKGDKSKQRFKPTVIAQPHRKHAVFIGAACLAQMTADNPNMWMNRNDWMEEGERALLRL